MSEVAAEVAAPREWRVPPLDGPQERLYAYIKERAVDGVLRAPIRVIGSAISIPTGSVPAAMTALEKKGWVARVYEPGRKAATGYRLVGADHPRPTAKLELVAKQKTAWRGGAHVASRNSTLSRHGSVEPDPGAVRDLRADHPALVQERTIYPSTVKSVWETERLLVSGHNNPKLGAEVQKGPWAGMPIYHLTLEERASCPRSCALWAGCYGNAMHLARRHDHRDPLFLTFLESELWMLARQHQNGFVVRLHTLGDFYSLDYVRFWAMALDWIPQLRAFGYTANRPDAEDQTEREIGAAIQALTDAAWNVFAIRFSGRAQPQGSVVLDEAADEGSGIIMCPAQSEATTACATCGVCWASAARDKTIGFLRHGKKART